MIEFSLDVSRNLEDESHLIMFWRNSIRKHFSIWKL